MPFTYKGTHTQFSSTAVCDLYFYSHNFAAIYRLSIAQFIKNVSKMLAQTSRESPVYQNKENDNRNISPKMSAIFSSVEGSYSKLLLYLCSILLVTHIYLQYTFPI
jgi:hypothetical protein